MHSVEASTQRKVQLTGTKNHSFGSEGSPAVKKREIIAAIVREQADQRAALGSEAGDFFSDEVMASLLTECLREVDEDQDLALCSDYSYLDVECCDTCHVLYPDEASVVSLPSGAKAWLCCAYDRALTRAGQPETSMP